MRAQGGTEALEPLAGTPPCGSSVGRGRGPDWQGPRLREEPRAAHGTRSPPLSSAICPCPTASAALGGRPGTPHPSLPPAPTARPFRLRGTMESHPAPNHSWGHHVSPYAGHVSPRLPALPEQPAVRQGALGPPRVGAAGARGEVAPPGGATGLCLCAHFGNCQFSSLANYLLGGGLKTVHTHKSPWDLNKRQWQVIFQHSPTLTSRERGRVGPRVGCGENELKQVQGPAPRHPGRLMEGRATRAWPASQTGTGVPRAAERPHPPTPTAQSPSCGVWTCGEEVSSLWVCLTTRAGVPQGSEYVCGVRPEQKWPQEAVSRAPQRASPCPTRATEHLPNKHSWEEQESVKGHLGTFSKTSPTPAGGSVAPRACPLPTHTGTQIPAQGEIGGPPTPPALSPFSERSVLRVAPGTAPPCSGRNPRHCHH